MIRLFIFDLDGTLVRTEKLKALSYARAVEDLRPGKFTEDEVMDAFRDFVGRSRKDVCLGLLDRFNLEEAARGRMKDYDAKEPWEGLAGVRLGYYAGIAHDPEVIRRNGRPHTIGLARRARLAGCRTALATTSHREQVDRVIDALGLAAVFDRIAAYEDVARTKPDPEIYNLLLTEFGFQADQALAIEDSPSGVRSALAAGVPVVALATSFTRERLAEAHLLPPERVAAGDEHLPGTVERAAPDSCLGRGTEGTEGSNS